MSGEANRLIVIDEDLNPEIAVQLHERGRAATSNRDLSLLGWKDKKLIPELKRRLGMSWILVTADNDMPKKWSKELKENQATVAVVGLSSLEGMAKEQRKRDVAHRWAHAFQQQEQGTVRFYVPGQSEPWHWRTRSKTPKSVGYNVPPGR